MFGPTVFVNILNTWHPCSVNMEEAEHMAPLQVNMEEPELGLATGEWHRGTSLRRRQQEKHAFTESRWKGRQDFPKIKALLASTAVCVCVCFVF